MDHNQPPPRVGENEYLTNLPLVEGVRRHDAGWAEAQLTEVGELVGGEQLQAWGEQANANPPVLHTHDRHGNRIDEVAYHPAYHEVIKLAVSNGAHALSWRADRPGAQVARAAVFGLFSQVEAGHGCPISMTHAAVPALRKTPELAAEWEPRLTASQYDAQLRPASQKPGALFGMGMTERQGGSDVRANITRATPTSDGYLLTGHKWFCSAPMSDGFLVLAQTADPSSGGSVGLSCFLVPRVLPDGSRNVFAIQRLKDKLGNRSNASSEVEFDGTWASIVGEPGRGVPTIIEMVNHTRLDCVIGAAAGMRQAVGEALWHAGHRQAFGKRLIEQPLMTNVLADLCVESEAATAAALRLARSYDSDASEDERLFRRLATAVMKYWVCKRGPRHAAEALECLGGNGYCETFPMARIYREAPLLSIWEGSGNVICLDVLRGVSRTPRALQVLLAEVELGSGADPRFDAFTRVLRAELADLSELEWRARRLTEMLALALQGSLLLRHAPAPVADAFCASRLAAAGSEYGALPPSVDAAAILARHAPTL
ncbi:MAG: acyl-CoA dehydrogenase family protein [Micromonosporaceae bacterium]